MTMGGKERIFETNQQRHRHLKRELGKPLGVAQEALTRCVAWRSHEMPMSGWDRFINFAWITGAALGCEHHLDFLLPPNVEDAMSSAGKVRKVRNPIPEENLQLRQVLDSFEKNLRETKVHTTFFRIGKQKVHRGINWDTFSRHLRHIRRVVLHFATRKKCPCDRKEQEEIMEEINRTMRKWNTVREIETAMAAMLDEEDTEVEHKQKLRSNTEEMCVATGRTRSATKKKKVSQSHGHG